MNKLEEDLVRLVRQCDNAVKRDIAEFNIEENRLRELMRLGVIYAEAKWPLLPEMDEAEIKLAKVRYERSLLEEREKQIQEVIKKIDLDKKYRINVLEKLEKI